MKLEVVVEKDKRLSEACEFTDRFNKLSEKFSLPLEPICEFPYTVEGGGPNGVNDAADEGGGPAGVVDGLVARPRNLSGVEGGLEL